MSKLKLYMAPDHIMLRLRDEGPMDRLLNLTLTCSDDSKRSRAKYQALLSITLNMLLAIFIQVAMDVPHYVVLITVSGLLLLHTGLYALIYLSDRHRLRLLLETLKEAATKDPTWKDVREP